MPVTTYNSEIEAQVSYTMDRQRFSDEEPGDIPTNMELHDLWMFGRAWRWSEVVDTFGNKGARAIERFIFDNVEVE
jgi:hypothetical protein